MANPTVFPRGALCLAALVAGVSAQAGEPGITRSGDLEMRCLALPTSELTPEAAREYNVARDPRRGLLTVTIQRHQGPGKAKPLQAQVFAGAINQANIVSTIPVREVQQGDTVYYLGEFHVTPPDTLRFLVNANTLHGRPLKAEFTRAFGAP